MTAERRVELARGLEHLARLSLSISIVLLPFRARGDVFPHPSWVLAATFVDLVIYALDVTVVATVGCWVAARAMWPRPIRVGPRALAWPVVGLLVLAIVTSPFAVEPLFSLGVALRLALAVAFGLVVVNLVERPAALAVPVGLMVAIQAVVAIGQGVHGGPLGLGPLGESLSDASLPGASVVTLPDGSRLLRAYGLSPHPNVLGGILSAGLVLLAGVVNEGRASRAARAVVLALGAAAVVLALSRGAWLGLAAGLLVGLALLRLRGEPRARRAWLMTAGAILAAAVLTAMPLRGAIGVRVGGEGSGTATESRSVDERLAQIELGLKVVRAHPLTGAGLGGVALAMRDMDPGFPYGFYPPHVVILAATADLGLPGGLAVVALFVAPWWLLLRWPPPRPWSLELVAASGAVAVLEVVSTFDDYPWVGGPGRILSALAFGVWALAYERASGRVGARA